MVSGGAGVAQKDFLQQASDFLTLACHEIKQHLDGATAKSLFGYVETAMTLVWQHGKTETDRKCKLREGVVNKWLALRRDPGKVLSLSWGKWRVLCDAKKEEDQLRMYKEFLRKVRDSEAAQMPTQDVRRSAGALRRARTRLRVRRAGNAGSAVECVRVDSASGARRVADNGLDKAASARLALKVQESKPELAYALAVVGGDGLVLQMTLGLEHAPSLAAFSNSARQTL